MSAAAEPLEHVVPDDNLARRNAMVLSAAQALAGGNNTVIGEHREYRWCRAGA